MSHRKHNRRSSGDAIPGTEEISHAYGGPLGDDPLLRLLVRNASDIVAVLETGERYRTLVERMPMIVYLQETGEPSRTTYLSPQYESILGYTSEDALADPEHWIKTIHPDDRERVEAEDCRANETGEPFTMEFRRFARDGRVVWIRDEATLVRDEEGRPLYWLGFQTDITDRREAEEALGRLSIRNQLILDSAGEGICGLNREGRVTFVNPVAAALTGFGPEYLVGKCLHEVIHHSRPDGPPYPREACPVYAVLTDGEVHRVDDEVFWRKDGTSFPVEYTSTPIREDGEVVGAVVIFTDVTGRREAEKRLEYQALHDSLTDLPNRQLLLDRLGQALQRTRRRRGRRVAVLFMDLDAFKVVNDSLGHEIGDRLLVAVSERLEGCLRPEDTLARFGGDEFIVLLEEVEGADEVLRVTRRITEEFRGPFVLDGRTLIVRLSIGAALGEAYTKSPDELLRDADTAMYRAKEEGVDYRVFDPEMYEHALSRLEMENELRHAWEKDEFMVYYQPKFRLGRSDRIEGVEALVRWEHPQRDFTLPDEFIPIAEETGLIIALGELVMKQACHQTKAWQERYPSEAPLTVCVNLSAAQVRHPGLLKDVKSALRKSGLAADSLVLDIAEGALLKDTEMIETVFEKLKALGVRLAIDDFGKEYSSLSYLNRLPVDAVKIDRSFLESFGENPSSMKIVEAVISLAHSLGLEVIGEGVESAGQLEHLRRMGCDFAQGYHLARPLPSEELERLLADQFARPTSI